MQAFWSSDDAKVRAEFGVEDTVVVLLSTYKLLTSLPTWIICRWVCSRDHQESSDNAEASELLMANGPS